MLQNTFAPNSSSSTNFYTQKNFHPRQDSPASPNNDNNIDINQENQNNNINELQETVTTRIRSNNEYSPSLNDGRKKNKMLHKIKNSLVTKIKNNILLKEINNAYNEMGRYTTEGDLASAKMMENELNDLQAEVIMTNLYPVTKFGKTYNNNIYSSSFNRSKFNTTIKRSKNNNIYEINKTVKSTRIINSNNNIINEENNVEEEENNNSQKK